MWSRCRTYPTGLCAWRPDADLYNTWRLDVDLSNTGRSDGDLLITDNMEMFVWYQVRERSLDQPRSDRCKPGSDNTNVRAVDLRVKNWISPGRFSTNEPTMLVHVIPEMAALYATLHIMSTINFYKTPLFLPSHPKNTIGWVECLRINFSS